MPRLVSFVVLVAILMLIGGLFFQVMAHFLLPLFLALVLAVISYPLYNWILVKCKGRAWIAAGLATLAILLVALLPLTWVLFRAVSEAMTLRVNQTAMLQTLESTTLHLRDLAEQAGIVLPTDKEIVAEVSIRVREFGLPAAREGVRFALSFLGGMFILIISLYYFFLDGPGMVSTIARLSPLDERYERQLINQFGAVSRAVVLATLMSAIVQGLLSGIAYWFVGLELAFLLTALTLLMALVPFVGAAAVWVPCCFWLYLYEGRPGAAIFLAVFGVAVVSMADNVVKPMILSGRSNLHPLLALLSVIGGVQALGPIGILVGPMIVAFLQVLLTMLRDELTELGKPTASS